MIMTHRPMSYSYIQVFVPFKSLLFSWSNKLLFAVVIWGCVLLLKFTSFGLTVQDPKHVPRYFSKAMIKGAPPPQCYDNTLPPPTPLCYSTPPHCPSLLFHSTSAVSNTGERGISMDFCPKISRKYKPHIMPSTRSHVLRKIKYLDIHYKTLQQHFLNIFTEIHVEGKSVNIKETKRHYFHRNSAKCIPTNILSLT